MKLKEQEEIDLLEWFLKLVNVIRLNFWLILLFFVIGTILGLAYYYSSPKVYQNKMAISSMILTKSYSKELTDKLNRHRSENNLKALATLLTISENEAGQISNIQIESLVEADEAKESDKFLVTADVYSQELLPSLERGLIHYFENNEYVKIRVDQNRSFHKQMLAKVEEEIKDMEGLKKNISDGTFFQSVKGNVMFDPTTVNSKILELTKEKLTLQNNLLLSNSVHVIEGFTKYQTPATPKLSVSLISGSLIGLFFVGVLIAYKSIRKLLAMSEEANQSL